MSTDQIANFAAKVGTATRGSRKSPRNSDDSPEVSAKIDEKGDDASDPNAKRRWNANDTIFWISKQSFDSLPAGLYKCGRAEGIGPFLDRQVVKTDNLLPLPDPISNKVLNEFRRFWTLKEKFKERGFIHKRGFLLWGPPGSGKTSLVQLMVKNIIEDLNGIVVFIEHPRNSADCLQMIRKIEPDRPLICIMEDIDALIERFGESEYLALLDGESQIENVIFVATTNYPERLDKRFVDRPSRFDTLEWVGMPSADARRMYLKVKEPSLSKKDLESWVELSDGFSIAHLRELIISVKCIGKTLEETISYLRKMQDIKPSSSNSPDKAKVGF